MDPSWTNITRDALEVLKTLLGHAAPPTHACMCMHGMQTLPGAIRARTGHRSHPHDASTLPTQLKATETEVHSQASPSGASGASGTATGGCSSCARSKAEASRLRGQLRNAWWQVAQMKEFLNDYGMVWVGEPGDGGEGHFERRESQPGDSKVWVRCVGVECGCCGGDRGEGRFEQRKYRLKREQGVNRSCCMEARTIGRRDLHLEDSKVEKMS